MLLLAFLFSLLVGTVPPHGHLLVHGVHAVHPMDSAGGMVGG